MAKRAMVQDRADDVFFGLSQEPEAVVDSPGIDLARPPATTPPRRPSTAERRARSSPAAEPKAPAFRSALHRLDSDAKINAAFRFSAEELDELDDFVRDAKRLHALRVTKQDVVRLALALLMDDYAQNGDKSQLIASVRARKIAR